ncbi:MAG: hypothetical protein P8Y54_10820, partial [Xanthomonadales bacterium]
LKGSIVTTTVEVETGEIGLVNGSLILNRNRISLVTEAMGGAIDERRNVWVIPVPGAGARRSD